VNGTRAPWLGLVSSAIALGEPVSWASARMLAWRFLTNPTNPGAEEEPPFLAFAILLLAARHEVQVDRGTWLTQLAGWVKEEESRARQESLKSGGSNPNGCWGLPAIPKSRRGGERWLTAFWHRQSLGTRVRPPRPYGDCARSFRNGGMFVAIRSSLIGTQLPIIRSHINFSRVQLQPPPKGCVGR
jgi:hypothetical protein